MDTVTMEMAIVLLHPLSSIGISFTIMTNSIISMMISMCSALPSCEFPSILNGQVINECQFNQYSNQWWCPIDENYDIYNQKTFCPNTTTTYGGNDPGKLCHFPFKYRGIVYTTCIKSKDKVNLNVYWWCATTSDYNSDPKHRWTRCNEQSPELPCYFSSPQNKASRGISAECRPFSGRWLCNTERREIRECPSTKTTYSGNNPGQKCHLPFLFNQREYRSCISAKIPIHHKFQHKYSSFTHKKYQLYQWCATTDNYDRDGLWTRCKNVLGNSVAGGGGAGQYYGFPSLGSSSNGHTGLFGGGSGSLWTNWSNNRRTVILVPVLVIAGALILVMGLAGLLYCCCDAGIVNGDGRCGGRRQNTTVISSRTSDHFNCQLDREPAANADDFEYCRNLSIIPEERMFDCHDEIGSISQYNSLNTVTTLPTAPPSYLEAIMTKSP